VRVLVAAQQTLDGGAVAVRALRAGERAGARRGELRVRGEAVDEVADLGSANLQVDGEGYKHPHGAGKAPNAAAPTSSTSYCGCAIARKSGPRSSSASCSREGGASACGEVSREWGRTTWWGCGTSRTTCRRSTTCWRQSESGANASAVVVMRTRQSSGATNEMCAKSIARWLKLGRHRGSQVSSSRNDADELTVFITCLFGVWSFGVGTVEGRRT